MNLLARQYCSASRSTMFRNAFGRFFGWIAQAFSIDAQIERGGLRVDVGALPVFDCLSNPIMVGDLHHINFLVRGAGLSVFQANRWRLCAGWKIGIKEPARPKTSHDVSRVSRQTSAQQAQHRSKPQLRNLPTAFGEVFRTLRSPILPPNHSPNKKPRI